MAAAHALALLAVCVALCVSANVLAWFGIPYTAEGGNFVLKLHPASDLCCLAAAARLVFSARSFCTRLVAEPLVALYLCAVAMCLVLELLMTGVGNLVVLLDTYLPAGLLAAVCCDATDAQRARLRAALQLCFVGNILLALIEGVTHSTLVPLAPDGPADLLTEAEFRPMALYDHPLTGAAMTLIAAFVPPDRASRPRLHDLYCCLIPLGLVAFGGRAAMAAGGLCLCWFGAGVIRRAVLRRHAPLRILALVPVAVLGGVAAGVAIYFSGLGGRLERHFYWDSSAQVRLDQWHVLDLLNAQQMMFGAARKDVIALLEPLRLAYGVPVIENFWLLMFLSLGLLGYPFFLTGLASLLSWCARQGGGRGLPMVLALLAAASTSNSLGRKSTLLLVLVAAASSMSRPVVVAKLPSPARSRQQPGFPQTPLPQPVV
jgi:hypothetical protein